MDKVSDEIINKMYAEYKQKELNEKGEKTGKALGKHVLNLHSTAVSRWLKIKARMLKNYGRILKMTRSSKIRWLT